ncbi:MAG: hypothetical protein ACR2LS_00680, partial [Thermomicrobiales bacterium]
HMVALTLAWAHEPTKFPEAPTLKEVLASKNKDELIDLIGIIVQRFPDMEDLVEMPLATPPDEDAAPIDAETVRRQLDMAVKGAFARGYDEAGPMILSMFNTFMQAAEGRAGAGRWSDAITIWEVLCDVIIDIGQLPYDEEGDLDVMLGEVEAAFSRAFEAQDDLPANQRIDGTQRADLIQRLVDLWILDHNHHDFDVSVDTSEVLARSLRATEKEEVDARLRSQIVKASPGDTYSTMWRNRTIVSLIIVLKEAVGASDQEIVDEYLAVELWADAASILIEQQRYDEAVALARRRIENPIVFLQVADRLATARGNHRQQAVDMVEERLWENEAKNKHDDQRFQAWLVHQYAFLGNAQDAMKIQRRRFEAQPSLYMYSEVETVAKQMKLSSKEWTALRAELIQALREKEQWTDLVDIHLQNREHDEALAALAKLGTSANAAQFYGDRFKLVAEDELLLFGATGTTYFGDQREHVAKTVSKTHPNEAIELYKTLAEEHIARRHRGSYAVAAGDLTAARDIYRRQKREAEWLAYIGELRQQNKTLRALQDELNQAKLESGKSPG